MDLNPNSKQSKKQHEDQLKREKIPRLRDLPTKYRPLHQFVMVVPLPDVVQYGGIILPDRSHIQMSEGHVVAKGRMVTDEVGIGDCLVWNPTEEVRCKCDDDTEFVLIPESAITLRIPMKELEQPK